MFLRKLYHITYLITFFFSTARVGLEPIWRFAVEWRLEQLEMIIYTLA